MKTENFSKAMNEIDDKYVQESLFYHKASVRKKIVVLGSLAACLILVGILLVPKHLQTKDTICLSEDSINVSVKYTDAPVKYKEMYSLVYLSEEDLLTTSSTEIIKGTVVQIKNIEITFKTDTNFGSRINYQSIVDIRVDEVYHGNLSTGDTISILLPCPIQKDNFYMEDTEVASQIREGMVGIFLPKEIKDSDYYGYSGATLMLKDLADYCVGDGQRFMFLDTDQGLVFDQLSYPSLENSSSLEDIEEFMKERFQK